MTNISPTIKVDISVKSGVIENIILGDNCSPKEIISYKSLFQ
jgi:hypothetical protein